MVVATTGDRVYASADKRVQRFEARDVRDVTVTAATRLPYPRADGRRHDHPHVLPLIDERDGHPRRGRQRLHQAPGSAGRLPVSTFKVVQSAGGYGMESPRLIWIPYGTGTANLKYLVTHETAHQWFYGLVGNDQARQPFADEAAADFVARSVLGLKRSSRCPTGLLDHDIYHYTSTCYYEKVYIQGGNLIDAVRLKLGSTRFWATLKGYVAAHRYGLSSTKTLLEAFDAATSTNLGATMFAPRFPTIY